MQDTVLFVTRTWSVEAIAGESRLLEVDLLPRGAKPVEATARTAIIFFMGLGPFRFDLLALLPNNASPFNLVHVQCGGLWAFFATDAQKPLPRGE